MYTKQYNTIQLAILSSSNSTSKLPRRCYRCGN